MKFDEYLRSNLGEHINDLSKKELVELKSLYDKLLIWQKVAKTTIEKGLNTKSGVDYTTDYEKAMDQAANIGQKLSALIQTHREKFGIDLGENASKKASQL